MKRHDPFQLGVAVWILAACFWPELKLALGGAWSSPGSTSSGVNLHLSELVGSLLGLAVLLLPQRRRRVPAVAWAVSASLALWAAFGAGRGLQMGWHPRDVLAEARFGLFALALLPLASLDAAGRRLALRALWSGIALFAAQQALLILLEPRGFANLNIVPIAVSASMHDLALQAPLGFLVLALGGPWSRPRRGLLAAAAGLWVLLWLSYVRALWVCLPLAAVAGTLWLAWRWGAVAGLRYLGFQAAAALLGLALSLGGLWAADPDGAFLLAFRMQRTGQALHLLGPLPPDLKAPDRCTTLLKKVVARGGLYKSLDAPFDPLSPGVDASALDRGLMRREALDAFKEAPLAGLGLGALFRYQVHATLARVQRDPHHGVAWVLAKTGLVGAGILLALLAMALRFAWLRRSEAASGLLIGCLALFFLVDVFQTNLLQPSMLMVGLPLAGLCRWERLP